MGSEVHEESRLAMNSAAISARPHPLGEETSVQRHLADAITSFLILCPLNTSSSKA